MTSARSWAFGRPGKVILVPGTSAWRRCSHFSRLSSVQTRFAPLSVAELLGVIIVGPISAPSKKTRLGKLPFLSNSLADVGERVCQALDIQMLVCGVANQKKRPAPAPVRSASRPPVGMVMIIVLVFMIIMIVVTMRSTLAFLAKK